MLQNYEEDSGRSSCSAASIGISPIIDYHLQEPDETKNFAMSQYKKHDSSLASDLKVCSRPRSYTNLLKSPDERDPFPSCHLPQRHRNVLFNLFNSQGLSGISNAYSTVDIACSTQLEEPNLQSNSVSMSALLTKDSKPVNRTDGGNLNFRRGKPVQRAASRLYKAETRSKEGCVGPEFIVRGSQPPKQMDLTLSALGEKRTITVILLNGQKVEVLCDPNIITAGQLFEALVNSEKYEHNFMLGIAILIGGDFVFLPDDYKIKKVVPEAWHKSNNKKTRTSDESLTVTVFLRIKFFLPKNIASNIQGGDWRYRVYLQLRRATVEGIMTSTIQNLILLAGYALHIEFGEFMYREHGTADYFLLEHYLPETLINDNMADIKLRMKCAHESRQGLDRNKAIVNYITLAQTFRDYGAHFYSAVWATRDGFCRDVWLSIGPRGVTLYSRNSYCTEDTRTVNNRIVLQSLPWHHIHTFYYNKKSLYILPNAYSGLSKIGVKYKLKMNDNKSFFTFWLASLHHRLYMKLYTKDDFLNYLSEELHCPTSPESPINYDCSNYQDSYNLAVRNPARVRRPVRRRFKIDIFGDKKAQNKENVEPSTEKLLQQLLSPQPSDESVLLSPVGNLQGNSSNDGISSSESCSLPRRHGVKMGTRVFNGIKSGIHSKNLNSVLHKSTSDIFKSDGDLTTTQSDSDDLSLEPKQQCEINSMKLLPQRQYNQTNGPTAYVLESPKVYPEVFSYNAISNESCLNSSIFEKLDNMECVQADRIFVTAALVRDENNALGLQVAEGSDGNVYIKSITSGSPADSCKKLMPGDQIISVNGQTLLNIKYDNALAKLQSAPRKVELIVLQNTNQNCNMEYHDESKSEKFDSKIAKNLDISRSIASALDDEITEDELLNEEALKTIYALIKLTKEKLMNRMKDKNSKQVTPNKSNLQKCLSESKVYTESDFGETSSQEPAPQKKNDIKFNTWRGQVPNAGPKRRPLSLSVPKDVDLGTGDYLNDADLIIKSPSLKSIQSSLISLESKSIKSSSSKNIALPRNFGLSRKWLGPVRYPVTPCKNSASVENSEVNNSNIVRKHFVYGAGDSDEDQIFI